MSDVGITGRSDGYRDKAIRCPGCAEPMRQLMLEKAGAEVDVCDGCGGLWVDWFDGEIRLIATETLKQDKVAEAYVGTKSDAPRPSRNEVAAVGACPRCTRQLVPERYEVKAEVASRRVEGKISVVPATTGAELLRCEECMGSFVTRSSAEVLTWISTLDEPPPSSLAPSQAKPVPWDSFVGVLKRFLGMTS